MQGSLIFVVIVAVWAAYLVQHWVRRREDAAATRSVDGFSDAMRVLQKRPFLRRPELAAAQSDSSSVTPSRSDRATDDVKRAQPARAASPLTARSSRSPGGPTAISRTPASTDPTQPDTVKVEPMPQTLRPNRAPDDRRRPTAPSMGPSMGLSMGQRRLRAALLLVALLWVPTSIVLSATNVLTWLSVPFAVITVAAVLFWLRTEVAADRARRVAAGDGYEAAAPALFHHAADDTQAVHTHAYAVNTDTTEADTAAVSAAAGAETAVSAAAARREIASFFDGEAATAVANRAGETLATPDRPAAQARPLAPGTWSPVPVPRPTYSLKAKAEPRLTENGIPADVFATPEFADEADELDERALFARRAVSG